VYDGVNGVEEQNSSGGVTRDMLGAGLDQWFTRTDSPMNFTDPLGLSASNVLGAIGGLYGCGGGGAQSECEGCSAFKAAKQHLGLGDISEEGGALLAYGEAGALGIGDLPGGPGNIQVAQFAQQVPEFHAANPLPEFHAPSLQFSAPLAPNPNAVESCVYANLVTPPGSAVVAITPFAVVACLASGSPIACIPALVGGLYIAAVRAGCILKASGIAPPPLSPAPPIPPMP
jgi:hypothetical protein